MSSINPVLDLSRTSLIDVRASAPPNTTIPVALEAIAHAPSAAGTADEPAGPAPPPQENQSERATRLFQHFIGSLSDDTRFLYYIDRERWVDFEYELRKCRSEEDLQRLLESYRRMPFNDRERERINAICKWLDDPQKKFQTAIPCILSLLFDLREPGYREGMVDALNHLRLGVRFNAKDYEELQSMCVRRISKMRPGYRRDETSSYGIDLKKITPEAKQELRDERLIQLKNEGEASYCRLYFPNEVTTQIAPEKLPEIVEELFNTYYQTINEAKTDEERLKCIVRLCRALEILHAFEDGNQRTVAFALLNKLLLENGFPPAILKDPFMFDGYYSVSQMVELILEGIEFTYSRLGHDNPLLKEPTAISEKERGMRVRFAAGIGDRVTLQKLLESGSISPEDRGEAVRTASALGYCLIVCTLLKSGAISDQDRGKAVRTASALGYFLIVSTLLESGAISDQDREDALCAACRHDYCFILISMLLKSGIIPDALFRTALENAARHGSFVNLERLLREPRAKQYIESAFRVAAEEGRRDVIERLLREPESKLYIGKALQRAVVCQHIDVIQILLQQPESRQYLGDALEAAADTRFSNIEIVERLLKEPQSKAAIGEALETAAKNGNLEYVQRLLKEDPEEQNVQAALDLARRWRRDEIITALNAYTRQYIKVKNL